MKQKLSILLMCVLLLACDSEQPLQQEKMSFSEEPTVSLVGGGRWFEPSDTGTYYDAYVNFSLANLTSTSKQWYYTITFGLAENGVFITDSTRLRSRSGLTIVSDTFDIASNSTYAVTDTLFVDLCQTNEQDWLPYFYTVTVHAVPTADSLVHTDIVHGSTPENRFHGAIYTTEQSPDPLSILDGPDDGDYLGADTNDLAVYPVYPNPTYGSLFQVSFYTKKTAAATVSFHYTPRQIFRTETFDSLMPGSWSLSQNLSNIAPGQYRLYLKLRMEDKKEYTVHGDILKIDF